MNSILDILLRGMDMIERFRSASAVTDIQLIGFGILLVFGDKLYFGVQASPFLDDAFCFCYRSGTWIWSLVFYGGQ